MRWQLGRVVLFWHILGGCFPISHNLARRTLYTLPQHDTQQPTTADLEKASSSGFHHPLLSLPSCRHISLSSFVVGDLFSSRSRTPTNI